MLEQVEVELLLLVEAVRARRRAGGSVWLPGRDVILRIVDVVLVVVVGRRQRRARAVETWRRGRVHEEFFLGRHLCYSWLRLLGVHVWLVVAVVVLMKRLLWLHVHLGLRLWL